MRKKEKKNSHPSRKYTTEELSVLSDQIAYKARDLLDYFGVEYEDHEDYLSAVCPIHEGADNSHGFTIKLVEGDYFGFWKCWTRGCEKEFVENPIGLVRAFLTVTQETKVRFDEVINFAMEFVGSSISDLRKKSKNIQFDHVNKIYKALQTKTPNIKEGPTPKQVRASLKFPADYYVSRGFKEETLNLFDVGVCVTKGKPMFGRIVVPVYDKDHQIMVGCVGRVSHENYNGNKWVNSKNFNSGSYLYGYWLAHEVIRKTQSIILVEGQGDVWRLHEAGIHNAVGIFGSSLSDAQARIIETSGVFNIIILTDNDKAGDKACQSIQDKCGRLYHIKEPEIDFKDVGDMTVEQIQQHLIPQIEGLI